MAQTTCSVTPRTDESSYADANLVAQLRAGDEAAMSQLVDQWSPTMLRIARSFVDSVQSAEDVVQDAWLGMLTGLAKFEGRASLRTWTFSILINRAKTRSAREARTLPQSSLASQEGQAADDWIADPQGERPRKWASIDALSSWDSAPENVLMSKEMLRLLDQALSELPARQRSVLTMRDVCGMSTEEVCAALRTSPQNQRVLLHRSRVALRTALEGYYRG
ncbi:sigma-70 family RNA polymerase sigma factor [Trebonia kvetii]|uniref:Sigma-70 family RNA polymerase sigma factor n=1 Tax=Trebonia kvetii TaxID=2480626 RepID=A0A6P2BWS8_9ACTN|nr:sigma-70 family RNA polymerase sigma factor [Trebonia kvetii]TVZ03514.1 sigma-70 family RNA polymerase sigma factor [Trebonia kvetii]